jgi:two-component system LytT family sensor kinase
VSAAKKRFPVWLPAAVLWLGPASFAIVSAVAQRSLHGEAPARLGELIWAGGDWFLYAFITPLVFWAAEKLPIVRPHLLRRTLAHFGLALLFCAFWAIGGKLLQAGLAALDPGLFGPVVDGSAGRDAALRDVVGWIFITLPFGIVVYASMAGLAHAIRYFEEARLREAQLAEARLSALQAQVNPHFLFNTLNTIAVRAREGDGRGSAEMVEQLAELLRRTMNGQRSAEVPLSEELELVRLSLGIEAARFSDRLEPEFAIEEEALAVPVPSFAIQHLVDNAIRHGIAKRSDAGQVRIVAKRRGDELVVTVADDGPGLGQDLMARLPRLPAGHGLENSRERLRVLHGERAGVELADANGGGTVATLFLPWPKSGAKGGNG